MYLEEYKNCLDGNLNNKVHIIKKFRELENEMRALFISERENDLLKNNYLNLLSVYDNYEMFEIPKMTHEDENQQIILNKNMDKLIEKNMSIVNLEEFKQNFNIFTEGLFDCMNWDNVLLAGGSVLAIASPISSEYKKNNKNIREWFHDLKYSKSDLDLFIYGLDEVKATKKLFEIYENIKKILPTDCICIRSSRAISIVSKYPYRNVQIILRLYSSPAEILMSFDIDSCSIGYDGNKVWCTPRAHYAITHKRNIIDLTRMSSSYEHRLKKYSERGYGVVVPKFDYEKINYKIYSKHASNLKGLAKLLILENLDDNVKHNIYRDVLDYHQLTMSKNIKASTNYEESDYSLVFLPWGKQWDHKSIVKIMEKKNNILNKNLEENEILNKNEIPRYLCFYGSMYQVVRDNNIMKPKFDNEKEEILYMGKFVCDYVRWHSTNNGQNSLGSFNQIVCTLDDWYKDAYTINNVEELCNMICKKKKDEILKIIRESEQKDPINGIKNLLDTRDVSNRNPLQASILVNNYDICKMLLNFGCNPMIVSKLGKTALHAACENGNIEIIKLILEYGKNFTDFNPNKTDSYKLSPILYTLLYGQFDAFIYMYNNVLKKNTDLIWIFKYDKMKSYRGLELCLLFKRYDMAEFLLKNGYDINDYYYEDIKKTSKSRKHILEIALELHDLVFIKMLTQNDFDNENLLGYNKNLLKNINKTKNHFQIKYYLDTLCYLYQSTNHSNYLRDIFAYLVEKQDTENLDNILEKWKLNLNNKIQKKESLVDWVNNLLLDILYEKYELRILQDINKFNKKNEKFNKIFYITSNNTDSINLLNNEDYKWLSDLQFIDEKFESKNNDYNQDIDKLDKKEKYLEYLKQILINNGCKATNNNPNKNNRNLKNLKENVDYKIKEIRFVFIDLNNGHELNNTVGYMKLYNLIKQGNIDLIRKFTLEENSNEILKLTVSFKISNYTPMHIAIMFEQLEIIINLIDIINKQTILKKLTKKNITNNKKNINLNNLKFTDKKEKPKTKIKNKSSEFDDFQEDFDKKPMKIKKYLDKKEKPKPKKKNKSSEFDDFEEDFDQKFKKKSNKLENYDKFDDLDDTELYAEENIEEVNNYAISDLSLSDFLKKSKCINFCIDKNKIKSLETFLTSNDETVINYINGNFGSLLDHACKLNNWEFIKIFVDYYKKNSKKNLENQNDIFIEILLKWPSIELWNFFGKEISEFDICSLGYTKSNFLHRISEKTIHENDNYKKLIIEIGKNFQNLLKQKNSAGFTPIMQCIQNNNFELFKIYLDLDPNLDQVFENEYYPIHEIIILNRCEMFKFLLETDKFNNLVDKQSKIRMQTPLMLAIKFQRNNMIIDLINKQCNQNILDVFGNTSLHYAMFFNCYLAVEKLVMNNIENYFRMTPSDYIKNKMKVSFHHQRNKKIAKKYNPIELQIIATIYNKFIKTNCFERVFIDEIQIRNINKYVLEHIEKKMDSIPCELKL